MSNNESERALTRVFKKVVICSNKLLHFTDDYCYVYFSCV